MKRLNDKEIMEAFDGDFREIPFDHKPTPEEVAEAAMSAKLRLVARKAEQETLRQVVEFLEDNYKRKDSTELEWFIQELKAEVR